MFFAYDKIQHYTNEFQKNLDADIGKFLSTGGKNTVDPCRETQTNIVGRFCDAPLLLQPNATALATYQY
jgi:hypothetical protein